MSSLQSEKLTDQRMLPGYAAGHDGRDGSNRVLRARAPGERTTGVHRNLTFPARLGVSRSGILVMPHQLRRMIMETRAQAMSSMPRREPWNKDKLIGQKPPLRPKHVWSIRTRLQMEGRTRDLAMFNLTIDSKLRGCDVVALRVEDVAPSGYAVDRATVRQKKTGRPVRFELTEQTRQAVDDYIKAAGKKPSEFLFNGRGDHNRCMTTRQYARLVSSWIATIGLNPHFFGTHPLRRTKATLIYRRTGNLYRPELMLPRQESCIERVSRVTDVVVWGGESHNICVSDP